MRTFVAKCCNRHCQWQAFPSHHWLLIKEIVDSLAVYVNEELRHNQTGERECTRQTEHTDWCQKSNVIEDAEKK